MSTANKLREMLVSYPRGEYTIDTLTISHPLLTQTYYLTREPDGVTATLENAAVVNFVGMQIDLQLNSTKDDLDQNFQFTMPDLDNALDNELQRIPYDNGTPIAVVYRAYISTDLSAPAAVYALEVLDVSQKKGAFTLSCGVSQLNWRQTGITYNFDDFPMLRAL
jgi:hypothetical protein